MGHDIRANALYTMDAQVAANPKNNETVYLCDVVAAEEDDILNVEVTPAMRKAAAHFAPARPNDPRSIRHKLEDIYEDYADNVTNIYGREPLHLLIDLGYHSAICWRWEDEEKLNKGTTEMLVLGDSGQGKSETVMRMREHYGRGERIDCKGATFAGLVGGLDDIAGKRWMYWGRIPQNDRGLVVLDEVKGMPKELVAQLTDVRSSQVATITKIGGRRSTAARVRYFWLSNPRGRLRICEYSNGVTSILDLLGTPEDVRRLDLAIIVSSGEVEQAFIDAKVTSDKKVPHVYTQEHARQLLRLAWSRTGTVLGVEIKRYVVQQASALARKYSPQIPLLEPADARMKIARLAVALAARLGSYTEDYSGVLVHKAHVDVVVEFIQLLYDSENFAFDRWSEGHREAAAGDDEFEAFVRLVNSMPRPKLFVEAVVTVQWVTRELLFAAIGGDKERGKDIINELLAKKYIRKSRGSSYAMLPKMIGALRTIQDDDLAYEQQLPDMGDDGSVLL